jgi:hypothetical protein
VGEESVRYWGGSVLVAAVAAVIFTTAAPVRAGSAAVGANLDAEPRISRQDSERLIRAVARMYDLDPSLLAAIARVESGGNPQAVSPKGAEGMMQLMPATAIRFGVLDPFDPVSNVLGAARFLAFLRNYHPRSDGSGPSVMTLAEMLAAYNAGEGAVDKYRGIPPYAETQQYVRRVLIAYLLGDDRGPLAEKLRASTAAPHGHASGAVCAGRAPAVRSGSSAQAPDALAKLGAIRAARTAQIDRESHPIGGSQSIAGIATLPDGGAK